MGEICAFQHKCRRCGAVYEEGITAASNALMFLTMIAVGQATPGIPIGEVNVHGCNDGGYGLSDVIGAAIRQG